MHKKTVRSVQFEITEQTRDATQPGSLRRISSQSSSFFGVAFRSRRIVRLDSIPGLSGRALSVLVWTRRPTARTRCDARKLR
jgi:hypothetical protein